MLPQSLFINKTIKRIISASLEWLETYRSFTSPLIDFTSSKGTYQFYVVINRVNNRNLHIQEVIVGNDGISRVYRNWTFIKETEWNVYSLEKEGKHVVLIDLGNEITGLDAAIDAVYKKTNRYNIYYENEVLSVEKNEEYSSYVRPKGPVKKFISSLYHEVVLHPSVFVPVLSASIIVIAFFLIAFFVRSNRIQDNLGGPMEEYLIQLRNDVQKLDSFKYEAEGELEVLKENLEKSKTDFEFNRQNAYVNVIRLGEELTRFLPDRKKAYKLIASNIKEAISYGEIIYEMSKLPSEEYQARILLATEEQNIIPLGKWKPVFSCMAYPVAINGRENDGLGFRITSGYTDKRKDPFRAGVVAHHFAVDIINVANVDYISYAGDIVREGMEAGDVVCVFEGVVHKVEVDEGYGNTIEIKHSITKEIKEMFPTVDYWTTFYAHLYEKPKQKVNDWVSKKEKLGVIGNSGRSTGPHLHFEVRVYCPEGSYWTEKGERFNKINPYPSGNKKE